MRCPFCQASDTRVIDSRLAGEGDQIRRRRECLGCGARFNTFEHAVLQLPRIVKGDNRREEFNEEKLRRGMQRALEKRPVSVEQLDDTVDRIIRELHAFGEREIPSRLLGEWVMAALRELDEVAFVRFASVYRSFEDVEEFRTEIERLENEPSPELRRRQIRLIGEPGDGVGDGAGDEAGNDQEST